MKYENLYVPFHPELDNNFSSLTIPRPRFVQAKSAIEQLCELTRRLPPETDHGEWGDFFYHSGYGQGALYTPFGKDGIATVVISVGGEIDENDLTRSHVHIAAAQWQVERFAYGLLAIPQPVGKALHFFFYQQAEPTLLRLEEFGSQRTGWFKPDWTSSIPGVSVASFGVAAPSALDLKNFRDYLFFRKENGLFTDMHRSQLTF